MLDNWHGYHSVPIHPSDRPLTTFLTPLGRYQYRTTPQGLLSAGDGYTQRMDLIVGDLVDSERCVDDSVLWDDSIETNFFRVCDFIMRCSQAGCIFNPAKFQFAEKTVDFLGFRITDKGIKPHPDSLNNIRKFPRPQNITDIRSWFGLIQQISYSFSLTTIMAPFRHLLSTKLPFYWSEELDAAFEASKEEIVQQCERGVRNFRLNAPTALATEHASPVPEPKPKSKLPKHLREYWVVNPNLTTQNPSTSSVPVSPEQEPRLASVSAGNHPLPFLIYPYHLYQPPLLPYFVPVAY